MIGLVLIAMLASEAGAEVPLPVYPECGEPDRPDLCPDDLDEEWWLISYIPAHARESVREAELELGSGLHADRAWRTTTGRFDVVVAAIDTGAQWRSTELQNKYYVNAAELPLPQDADGNESEDYDRNGDGAINVQDWAEDPRVEITAGRDTADHMLDVSDLIYTEWGAEWDGVDNDGNGYVDDISGWDFFGRDNDPWQDYQEDTYGDHGDGTMRDIGSEGGNGGGGIGVCPSCAVLPIRVADVFVVDGNRSAEAIAFAVDSGAVATSMAYGAVSDPAVVHAISEYAFENGLSLIGVSGDENSYHSLVRAAQDNIVIAHSITYDTGSSSDPVYSYSNTWNCNNFGMRMTVVAPSPACATGSAANITGMVGLLHSAARDLGIELHAGEVFQLLTRTADDIWLSEEERLESEAYPSREGWDSTYGYGRVNADTAVNAVLSGTIPPWISIDSPTWFEPVFEDEIEIRGTISGLRTDHFSYTVEVGTGSDPEDWVVVSSGTESGLFEGTLGTLDIGSLDLPERVEEGTAGESLLERYARANEPAVTIRIRVTDADGRESELRKTIFAMRDDSLADGFPVHLGSGGESPPILVDLDDDGVLEIVLGSGDGDVFAYDGTGAILDGWPVRTDSFGVFPGASGSWLDDSGVPDTVMGSVAAGDLDGDGGVDLVATTLAGFIYSWNADGSLRPGFPVRTIGREPAEFDDYHSYDQGFMAAPTIADIDGDGRNEIIVPAMDSRLYVLDGDGADWGPYPLEICHPDLCGVEGYRIINSATVGDVDGDGDLDIGFGTNENTLDRGYTISYLLDGPTGEPLEGWPWEATGLINELMLPLIGQGHPTSMSFADLDGDGDLEISNPVMLGTTDLLHHDGSSYSGLGYYADRYGADNNVDESLAPSFIQVISQGAFGDLDEDGTPDLVMGGYSSTYLLSLLSHEYVDYQQPLLAWSGVDGSVLPGFPRQVDDVSWFISPAIADVSGDGVPEAIYGSAGHLLHAWDQDGTEPDGWPKFMGGWMMGGAAVGDIDGDGLLEVVVSTRAGWLYVWNTEGPADQDVQWASTYHDAANTGNYETLLPQQAGPPDTEEGGRCDGCSTGVGNRGSIFWVLTGLLLVLRRRETSGEWAA